MLCEPKDQLPSAFLNGKLHMSDYSQFAKLLAEARAGSSAALGEALLACSAVLKRHTHRLLGPATMRSKWDDSDLLQMTFLEAQRSFAQFKGTTVEEFLSWLLNCAKLRCASRKVIC